MIENCSLSIGLKCGWNGLSKDNSNIDQSKFNEELILLSGPYGDDVAFIQQSNDQILLGLSDGVSGNRHHGYNPYEFAHRLILSCLEENNVLKTCSSSSFRGLIHRAIRSIEKRSIFGSATLCLLSIEKRSSLFRSINIGDSGFMLIRDNQLLIRSYPQYHRGSSPFQLSFFPSNHFLTSNQTRFYHDKPSDGQYIEHHLQIGDLLLIASDGLFDNLYEDFIIQIINNHLNDQDSVQSLENVCQILVQSAFHAGIKRDDILVLLCSVVPSSTNKINSSSSSSSLTSLQIHQKGKEEEKKEDNDDDNDESLNLFIFDNENNFVC